VYQLDHISRRLQSGFMSVLYGNYISLLRHFVVWDYSWYAVHRLLPWRGFVS
jgi:hypothetical protein